MRDQAVRVTLHLSAQSARPDHAVRQVHARPRLPDEPAEGLSAGRVAGASG
jgi:hypothetical protein